MVTHRSRDADEVEISCNIEHDRHVDIDLGDGRLAVVLQRLARNHTFRTGVTYFRDQGKSASSCAWDGSRTESSKPSRYKLQRSSRRRREFEFAC